MLTWMVVPAAEREVLKQALTRAWRGGSAVAAEINLPPQKKKLARPLLVVWPEGARALRGPRWPDVLDSWHDINEDELFPVAEHPVAAEEASGLGAENFICHGAPGLAHATVAWYQKGAVAEYEHVGSAQVAWTPVTGLGRPLDGSTRQALAMGGKKLAELVGADDTVNIMERIQDTSRAVGETLIRRAFLRLAGIEPPPIDELNGLVATAPRLSLAL